MKIRNWVNFAVMILCLISAVLWFEGIGFKQDTLFAFSELVFAVVNGYFAFDWSRPGPK